MINQLTSTHIHSARTDMAELPAESMATDISVPRGVRSPDDEEPPVPVHTKPCWIKRET